MTRRTPKPLPPPTMQERAAAARSARALRAAIADPRSMGDEQLAHIDERRPRRTYWITTWSNLPGFRRVNGRFEHDLLPGLTYARSEVRSELIPDLEALAERGVRPTQETSSEAAA